jgi:predicted O-linked N-acetylglucosamine transferase (SPINDLY family)
MLGTWARILNNVPGSRLVIKSPGMRHKSLRTSLYAEFQRAGIPEERVIMQGLLPTVLDHLEFISSVDIALDSYPYNGTTTTCESLFMGVPVISCAGRTHVSRVGASILSVINLGELVAESVDDYIEKARVLASDGQRLIHYRNSLREKMLCSPLMDVVGFTGKLESAYREMWRLWCLEQNEEKQA